MAFTSADVSGMVGGQMAMFSNQAQFSQQIGGMVGTSPMGMSGGGAGMQNPFPSTENMGSRIAGGMGMALPGIATGASLAGGLMGGTMGWLDPFTAAGRGFAGGAGVGGAGLGQTLGHVGRAFAQGGVRAGLGVMGGGLAGAAVAAAPIAALGAGISFAGEQMYAGAQNIAQVGSMAQQYMGPQFGQVGARSGGQFGRDTIKQMTGALHELVGEEGIATMKELKGVMDQAGRMGMLTGIGDVSQFKNKMRDMVRNVKALADVMGVTMEQAGPMLGQFKQMGLWKTSDILGAAVSMKGESAQTSGAMLGSMGAGAQMSHALGGTRRAGALMGQQSFLTMQAAVRSGALSNDDIEEFTGGLGGSEGQAAVGQRMMGIMGNFGRTSAGRAMMVSLGEMKDGQYTGGIDKERLRKFMQGGSTSKMMQEGYSRSRGRDAAMSFERHADTMGQNLMAEGGMEAMAEIVQKIADEKFKGNENARHHLFRQMLGVDNRTAEMLGKLADKLPQIRDQQSREFEAKTRRTLEELERKNLRSMDALGRSFDIMFEQVRRPFQELGESLSTSIGQMVDSVSEKLTGTTKSIPMAAQERARLLRGGALTQDMSRFSVGAQSAKEWANASPLANLNLAMREQGSMLKASGGLVGGMMAGAAMGSVLGPMGTVLGGLAGGVAGAAGALMIGGSPRERYLQNIGVSMQASGKDLEAGLAAAVKRAESPDRKALGISDEKKLGAIKARLSSLIANNSAELADLKKSDPQGYTKALLQKLESSSPTMFAGMTDQEKLNYLAVAQAEEHVASGLSADFKEDAARVGYVNTGEGARKKQAEIISGLSSLTGASEEQLTKALTSGPGSDIVAKFVSGGMTKKEAIGQLARTEGADDARKLLEGLKDSDVDAFKKSGSQFIGYRGAELQAESYKTIQKLAASGSADISGLSRGTKAEFSKLLATYKGNKEGILDYTGYNEAQKLTEALAGRDLSAEEVEALKSGGGAIGRQVVGLHEAMSLGAGGGMDEKKTSALLKKFQGLGYNIEELGGEEMKKMLSDRQISRSESVDFQKKLVEIMKGTLTETRGAKDAMADEMKAKIEYLQANTRFVDAVNSALGKSLKEAAAGVENAAKAQSPQASVGTGG